MALEDYLNTEEQPTEKKIKNKFDSMTYKELNDLLKKENPKIHLGHAMEQCRMWNVDAHDKKHYYNAMMKAGLDSRCQKKDRSVFKFSNIDKKTKLSGSDAMAALILKMPERFKKKMKIKQQTEEFKREKPEIVDDGFKGEL